MSISDLIRDEKKGSNFDELIPLSKIQTQEDILNLKENAGIQVGITYSEFQKRFPSVNPDNIYFSNSVFIPKTIYLDKNKYMYKELPMYGNQFLRLFDNLSEDENMKKFVDVLEELYNEKDYMGLLINCTDSAKIYFFKQMIKDKNIKNIYSLFFKFYSSMDYSINELSLEEFKLIINRKSEKDNLRTRKELANLKIEDDVVTVYRGEGDLSTHFRDGAYSWTTDINVANFFAVRYSNKESKIFTAKINKKDIIECITTRGEKEVIVLPENVFDVECFDFLDVQELQKSDIIDFDAFYSLKYILKKLNFPKLMEDSHSKEHSLRVLFLALMIANKRNLSLENIYTLGICAVFHDVGRVNDKECINHGANSYKQYLANDYPPDELKEFLMTYHCKSDEDALQFLNSIPKENQAIWKELLFILKDADALDRVRFGIRGVDMNQIRFIESKKLLVIANACLNSLKL